MPGVRPRHLFFQTDLHGIVANGRAKGCTFLGSSVQIWIPSQRVYTYPDGVIACPPHFAPELPAAALTNPASSSRSSPPPPGPTTEAQSSAATALSNPWKTTSQSPPPNPRIELFSCPEWGVKTYEGLEAAATIPSVGIELPISELYALAMTVPE
ncbi:hypothetical protein BH11ARM2_BH11ARM2_09800 [soil metagenome]